MYSEGHGDGGNLFSGGGFMPSQSTALQTDSTYNSASRKSGPVNQSLMPLTVKQISSALQKATDDNFVVDGQEVSNVTLVGLVTNKEEKVTDVSFILDDGTGRIEVKRWVDPQDNYDQPESSSIRNQAYIRVHGHLRSFQGKKSVHAFATRAITDFNEVTFHFLECIYVHLSNTKGQGNGATNPLSNPSSDSMPGTKPNLNNNSNSNQYTTPAPSTMGSSVDDCQKRVQQIFDDPASLHIVEGLHVDDVVRRMPGYDKRKVREAVDFLQNEGLIYSSIDEDHYKSIKSY